MSPVPDQDIKDRLVRSIRFHREMSDTLYSDKRASLSGADAVKAEEYRLVAAALTKCWQGMPIDEALAWYHSQFKAFADEMNAKIKAAPKLNSGPMSGCSVLHHKYPGDGSDGDLAIRRHYHRAISVEGL